MNQTLLKHMYYADNKPFIKKANTTTNTTKTLHKHYTNTTNLIQNETYSLRRQTQNGISEHVTLIVI